MRGGFLTASPVSGQLVTRAIDPLTLFPLECQYLKLVQPPIVLAGLSPILISNHRAALFTFCDAAQALWMWPQTPLIGQRHESNSCDGRATLLFQPFGEPRMHPSLAHCILWLGTESLPAHCGLKLEVWGAIRTELRNAATLVVWCCGTGKSPVQQQHRV